MESEVKNNAMNVMARVTHELLDDLLDNPLVEITPSEDGYQFTVQVIPKPDVEDATRIIKNTFIPLQAAMADLFGNPTQVFIQRDLTEELSITLRQRLLTQQIEVFEYAHPLTWWGMLRSRWMPTWVNRRWPIRYKTVTVDLKALFVSSVDATQPAIQNVKIVNGNKPIWIPSSKG